MLWHPQVPGTYYSTGLCSAYVYWLWVSYCSNATCPLHPGNQAEAIVRPHKGSERLCSGMAHIILILIWWPELKGQTEIWEQKHTEVRVLEVHLLRSGAGEAKGREKAAELHEETWGGLRAPWSCVWICGEGGCIGVGCVSVSGSPTWRAYGCSMNTLLEWKSQFHHILITEGIFPHL